MQIKKETIASKWGGGVLKPLDFANRVTIPSLNLTKFTRLAYSFYLLYAVPVKLFKLFSLKGAV